MAVLRKASSATGLDTLKRVRRACRRAFLAVWLFSFGVNLLMLAVPIYMMQIFDRVISTRNVDTLIMLTVMVAIALVTMATLDGVRGFVAARTSLWLNRVLGPPILEATVHSALRSGHRGSAQALRDLMTVRNFLGGAGVFPLFDAPWAPVFLGVTYLLHPLLGMVATVGLVLLFLIALANEAFTRAPVRESGEVQTRGHNEADTTVRNADVIAAMGMLPALCRRWSEKGEVGLKSQGVASQRSVILLSGAKMVRMFLQASVLATGAYLAINSVITPGTMIAASILMNRAAQPIEAAIGTWRNLLNAWFAYKRIKNLFSVGGAAQSPTALPPPAGRLVLDQATWVPLGQREPVLRQIKFVLDPGEALGVIGHSAAGKTSLIRMIVGSLAPTAGAVRLDGAEVSVWDAADRGQYVGYLPQDVELFDGTVKENIARFSDVSDEAVIEAAQLAGAHAMILELPLGYDTDIGGNGVPLSGGQRQKIGLARALLGQPRLVVLDEPNAHLDISGEQALVEALRHLKRAGVTVVMVAQRFAGLKEMDKLLLLRNGTMAAFGPRDEVLANIGRQLHISEVRPAARTAVSEGAS